MALRLRPQTLSAAHYFFVVATLLLLGGGVGILFHDEIPLFYAEHVTLPPLARQFGFTWREEPDRWGEGGHTITSVVAGGVFDRVGIRPDDHLYTGLQDLLYVLNEARQGRRMELLLFTRRKDESSNPSRCVWIDLEVLRTHPEKRLEGDLDTTQRYMHLSPAALDAAIRLLDGPAQAGHYDHHCGRGEILEAAGTEG